MVVNFLDLPTFFPIITKTITKIKKKDLYNVPTRSKTLSEEMLHIGAGCLMEKLSADGIKNTQVIKFRT